MPTIDNSYTGKTVNFAVYPSSIITSDFTNVKIEGIVSAKVATGYAGFNPVTAHANIYPYLPTGAPTDYNSYEYVLVTFANGNEGVVGLPWIIPESVSEVTGITVTVTLTNQSTSAVDDITKALVLNGITDFAIKTS